MAGNTATSFGETAIEKNRGTDFKQIDAALDSVADRRAARRCARERNGVDWNGFLFATLGIRNAAFGKQTRQVVVPAFARPGQRRLAGFVDRVERDVFPEQQPGNRGV